MEYFLQIDGDYFEDRLRRALTASWRFRSFMPCRDLCEELLPRVQDYHERFHVGEEQTIVEAVVGGMSFDRNVWYALAGEVLLYSADEVPEFQTCLETVRCLVSDQDRRFVEQAHLGSHALQFGAAVYRPEHCGVNERGDVERLARFLVGIDPYRWGASSLAALPELPAEDREEELAHARDWFPALVETYQQAARMGRVIVHEFV